MSDDKAGTGKSVIVPGMAEASKRMKPVSDLAIPAIPDVMIVGNPIQPPAGFLERITAFKANWVPHQYPLVMLDFPNIHDINEDRGGTNVSSAVREMLEEMHRDPDKTIIFTDGDDKPVLDIDDVLFDFDHTKGRFVTPETWDRVGEAMANYTIDGEATVVEPKEIDVMPPANKPIFIEPYCESPPRGKVNPMTYDEIVAEQERIRAGTSVLHGEKLAFYDKDGLPRDVFGRNTAGLTAAIHRDRMYRVILRIVALEGGNVTFISPTCGWEFDTGPTFTDEDGDTYPIFSVPAVNFAAPVQPRGHAFAMTNMNAQFYGDVRWEDFEFCPEPDPNDGLGL